MMTALVRFFLLVTSFFFASVAAFFVPICPKTPLTIHYYDYFKKNKDGTKKDIKRLWKNIMFPGIYTDYEDTAEPMKTIKIDTNTRKSRYDEKEIAKFQKGSYSVADVKSIPSYAPLPVKVCLTYSVCSRT